MKSLLLAKPKMALELSFATALAALTCHIPVATFVVFAPILNVHALASINSTPQSTTAMKENAKSAS